MTMTDPIADMLTRIRNATVARHDSVRMPSSKLKEALADVLEREGYIASHAVTGDVGRPGRTLEINLKFTEERQPIISGLRRVSKPGLRVYIKADEGVTYKDVYPVLMFLNKELQIQQIDLAIAKDSEEK